MVINDNNNFAPSLFWSLCESSVTVLDLCIFLWELHSQRKIPWSKTITSDFTQWPQKKMVRSYYCLINNSRARDSLIRTKLCTSGDFTHNAVAIVNNSFTIPEASQNFTTKMPKTVLFWHCFYKVLFENFLPIIKLLLGAKYQSLSLYSMKNIQWIFKFVLIGKGVLKLFWLNIPILLPFWFPMPGYRKHILSAQQSPGLGNNFLPHPKKKENPLHLLFIIPFHLGNIPWRSKDIKWFREDIIINKTTVNWE